VGAYALYHYTKTTDGGSIEHTTKNSDCNVQVVHLVGDMDTSQKIDDYGNYFGTNTTSLVAQIHDAGESDQIKAVVLNVDSGGGSPVAGAEIAGALSSLDKPSVAWMRSIAASGAYWASLGASHLVAEENSDVGSIGATASYLEEVEKNRQDGLTFRGLASGKFKDTGNPAKELSEEEQNLVQQQVDKIAANFTAFVAKKRGLPLDTVKQLADGSTWLGAEAYSKKLVDEVGGLAEVSNYLEKEIGEPVKFCWQ
jgi:protease-4